MADKLRQQIQESCVYDLFSYLYLRFVSTGTTLADP
jgi:hypothetical protein